MRIVPLLAARFFSLTLICSVGLPAPPSLAGALEAAPRSRSIALNRPGAGSVFEPVRLRSENLSKGEPPKMHPGNSAFRFALELGALGAMGWWGFDQGDGAGRYALMAGVPIAAAAAWGIFAVPSDPSRGKDGLVAVSGKTRLLLEATFFGFAAWALHDLDENAFAAGFGSAVILHYTLSFDRVKWLIKQ